MSKKAVLIGAGQYGRGVIAMLLEQSGYHVLLADINGAVIDDINARGEYVVRRMQSSDSSVTVKNISAMSSLDPGLVIECADADIVCTCVGLNALPKIAGTIAAAVSLLKANAADAFLNVLACENAIGGSTVLKGHVLNHLDAGDATWLEDHIGFPDCAIDGIIPPVANALPADVTAEEYYEWDSLKGGLRGNLPEIKGLNIVDDLAPYLERKLFTLNGPNAVTGAYGHLKGYETVQDSLADDEIYSEVWQMMAEAGAMLSARHGFTDEEMLEYRSFIMERFRNPSVIDSCARVVREPLRKLAANDRITAPMNYALSFGLPVDAYCKGIAVVMSYDNPEDFQSAEMQKMIKEQDFRSALETITGIADPAIIEKIENEYNAL